MQTLQAVTARAECEAQDTVIYVRQCDLVTELQELTEVPHKTPSLTLQNAKKCHALIDCHSAVAVCTSCRYDGSIPYLAWNLHIPTGHPTQVDIHILLVLVDESGCHDALVERM